MNVRTSITTAVICLASLLNAVQVKAQNCVDGKCRINDRPAAFQQGPSFPEYRPTSRLPFRGLNDAQVDRGSLSCANGRCGTNTACGVCGCDHDCSKCECGPNCPPHGQRPLHSERYQSLLSPRAPRPLLNDRRLDSRTPQYSPVSYRRNIDWATDIRAAAEHSRATGQPMLVQVTASWCGYCQKMKQETYTDRNLIAGLNRDFITVSLDADANREIVQRMKIQSLPTTLVVLPNLEVVDRLEGFQTATELQSALSRHMQRAELQTRTEVAIR